MGIWFLNGTEMACSIRNILLLMIKSVHSLTTTANFLSKSNSGASGEHLFIKG